MRTNLILSFIIAILIVILFAYDGAIEIVRGERDRIKENYQTIQEIEGERVKEFTLKQEELTEKQKALIDSLAKQLKVKPKHITSIHEIHIHDTIRDTVKTIAYNCDSLSFRKTINCVDITYNYKNGEGHLGMEKSTYLYIVDYTERNRLFGVKFLPKWGKKEAYQNVIDSCNGDTILKNRKINIER